MPRTYEADHPEQHQRIPLHTRDEGWVKEFLRKAMIGHLGHSQDGQPFVTPTNFFYDETGHRIIFHSNIAGRTRFNLEHNPLVCMETNEVGQLLPANTALEFGIQYRSVMVFGEVEILENNPETTDLLYKLLHKYFPDLTPGIEYRPITAQELARTTVYAINIASWSGKENWYELADELPDWPPLSTEVLTRYRK